MINQSGKGSNNFEFDMFHAVMSSKPQLDFDFISLIIFKTFCSSTGSNSNFCGRGLVRYHR